MVVVLKCLLAVAVVGVCTEANRVKVDISEAADEKQSSAPAAGDFSEVRLCKMWTHPHTYIDIGDGGCFMHLQDTGEFVSNVDDKRKYGVKNCPFAGNTPKDVTARKLFLRWYKIAIHMAYPPWSINDLAMSCMEIDPISSATFGESLPETFLTSLQRAGDPAITSIITKSGFCDMMLSLPLMFEAIGFDGPGLVMEDVRTKNFRSLRGEAASKGEDSRYSKSNGDCGVRSSNLGSSKYARLALRAILPTYFRHRYAQSGTGMFVKGARALFSSNVTFPESHWQTQVADVLQCPQVDDVCKEAGNSVELDQMFSLENLGQQRALLSKDAMDRDKGTKCRDENPCSYPSDKAACSTCGDGLASEDKDNPAKDEHGKVKRFLWFDKTSGKCYNGDGLGFEYCEEPEVETECDCYKAICWYFTNDFQAAFKAVNKKFDGK